LYTPPRGSGKCGFRLTAAEPTLDGEAHVGRAIVEGRPGGAVRPAVVGVSNTT
jgi:hypothetical protein